MRRKSWKVALLAITMGTVCQFSGACISTLIQAIPIGAGFTLGADLSQSLGLGSLLPGLGGTE